MDSKTAVITGANSGIGAAYAARFAKEGYDLATINSFETVLRPRAEIPPTSIIPHFP